MKNQLALVLPLLFLTGCETTDLKRTVTVMDVVGRIATPKTGPVRLNLPRTIRTVEKGGITFNLLQCSRKGQGEVACKFSVVSKKKDRTLGIYGGMGGRLDHLDSRAVASGNEYFASSVSIGGSEKKSYISRTLIANVRMEVSVSFSSIPGNLNRFAALELGTRSISKVQFTNVAIQN